MKNLETEAPYDAAIQGGRGSNSEIAARILLASPSPRLLYCERSEEVFEAVSNETAVQAVVAVENVLAGPVSVSFDLLYQHKLYINAETEIRIEFALVALPGVTLEDVKYAHSHPMALAQCRIFFDSHRGIKPVADFDTAGSVEKVIKESRRDAAGIAGRWTADIFGGIVLADNIEDEPENYTRFFLVSRDPRYPMPSERYKIGVVFVLEDVPGALFRALRPFEERGINVNFEKRPIKGTHYKYWFYFEIWSDSDSYSSVDEALSELERFSTSMRVLGKFPVRAANG